MWNIQEQVLTAANSLNISIQKIETKDVEHIVNQVTDKFSFGRKVEPLWEHLKNQLSVNNKEAWLWIDELVGDAETIMFFNSTDEKVAFFFNKGVDIVSVLNETYGFEFYLTNRDTEYLICFNHHDVLIVCGSAIESLKKYKTIEYDAFMQK